MEAVKPVYLLLICQGFYLGSVGQWWTFPSTITALIGSCVEIPCSFLFGTTLSPAWFLYIRTGYPEILNTEDSSSVLAEYRGRTSLVPGQECTLRIDPVRKEDGKRHYYPGTAGDKSINAYKMQSNTVNLLVTASVNMQLNGLRPLTEGEAIAVRCTAEYTCRSSRPYIQWNKPGQVIYYGSVDNSGGSWREESQLTYMASYEDNGGQLQCIATYHNGQRFVMFGNLIIYHAPKKVTVTIIGKDEVIEGSDVTLQCNSVSNPNVYKYEWYKGKEKSKLQDTGREIIVRRVTGNMEAYSCTAINRMGRGESALMDIPVLYEPPGTSSSILPAVIGVIGLLLLVLLVYWCWRKKCQKLKSNETETSPDDTYINLRKEEIGSDYNGLELENSTNRTDTGGRGRADIEYANEN